MNECLEKMEVKVLRWKRAEERMTRKGQMDTGQKK